MSENPETANTDASTLATGTIEGTVTDGDGNAEPDVTVKVIDREYSFVVATTTTDSKGDYSVSVASDQEYDVRFEKLLHDPTQVDAVKVVAGSTTTIDATLSRRTYKTRGRVGARHGIGMLGRSTATSGEGRGVVGIAESEQADSIGVRGIASGSGFTETIGVDGRSNAEFGIGVRGESDTGVKGITDLGSGVHGKANDSQGSAYGVVGETESQGGRGVMGTAYGGAGGYSSTAYVDGVYGATDWGRTDDNSLKQACGVRGRAAGDTGYSYAVRGEHNAPEGAAVYAEGHLHATMDSGSQSDPEAYVALIEDEEAYKAATLALKVADDSPGNLDNFVTFFDGNDTALGAIEANGSGGVKYKSGGADFAECLPKADPDATFEPGAVVGIHEGQISRKTADADRLLVVSARPAVAGNAPRSDPSGHETVAFTGQVPVRVRGTVETGDVIVPSGENDGTAVAVDPREWEPNSSIVGQAWEGTEETGVSEVTVAVGIGDGDVLASAVKDLQEENAELRKRVDDLEARMRDLEGAASNNPASADD